MESMRGTLLLIISSEPPVVNYDGELWEGDIFRGYIIESGAECVRACQLLPVDSHRHPVSHGPVYKDEHDVGHKAWQLWRCDIDLDSCLKDRDDKYSLVWRAFEARYPGKAYDQMKLDALGIRPDDSRLRYLARQPLFNADHMLISDKWFEAAQFGSAWPVVIVSMIYLAPPEAILTFLPFEPAIASASHAISATIEEDKINWTPYSQS